MRNSLLFALCLLPSAAFSASWESVTEGSIRALARQARSSPPSQSAGAQDAEKDKLGRELLAMFKKVDALALAVEKEVEQGRQDGPATQEEARLEDASPTWARLNDIHQKQIVAEIKQEASERGMSLDDYLYSEEIWATLNKKMDELAAGAAQSTAPERLLVRFLGLSQRIETQARFAPFPLESKRAFAGLRSAVYGKLGFQNLKAVADKHCEALKPK